MLKRSLQLAVFLPLLTGFAALAQDPPVPLAQRIAHTDPAKYKHLASVHNGSGPMDYMQLYGQNDPQAAKFNLGTNLFFLHRGVLPPGGGIGSHFHNQCEEMFVILDGEAQYTIDSRTSVLKGPAGAPVRLGHSHAISNASGKTVQWMNINIGLKKGFYDAFNLDDSRVGAPLDKVPTFITMHLDRSLLKPVEHVHGAIEPGTLMFRRALGPSVFYSPWSYMDHLMMPPGSSFGPITQAEMSEVWYVMAGSGRVLISGDGAEIHTGDAVPVALGEKLFVNNDSGAPLEFMIIGIARDLDAKAAYMVSPLGTNGFVKPQP